MDKFDEIVSRMVSERSAAMSRRSAEREHERRIRAEARRAALMEAADKLPDRFHGQSMPPSWNTYWRGEVRDWLRSMADPELEL